jgi:hypothetical protein
MISTALLVAAAGQVHGSFITLTFDRQEAGDYQSNTVLDNVDHSIGGVVDDGRSVAITTNYGQPNADTVVLKWTMSHTHGGVDWTHVETNSITRFIAEQDSLTYEIDGKYEIDGVSGPPHIWQTTRLFDMTSGLLLFDSYIGSLNTLNVVHYLDGGGEFGPVTGSLTGSLILGHEYEWSFNTFVGRSEGEDGGCAGGAAGSGFRTLTIASNASAVPEPASLTLFGLGALGFVAIRRRSGFVGGKREAT